MSTENETKQQTISDAAVGSRDLLGCPCCGGRAEWIGDGISPGYGFVQCTEPSCEMRTRSSAIAAYLWNRRVQPNKDSEIRPFEEQTALERTIRAIMWQSQDRLKRAEASLAGYVKRKEYQAAADCQTAMRKAASEIAIWEEILNLYEQERQSPNIERTDRRRGGSVA